MATFSADSGRPILPPEELRCVWMTAGILSYQLCDRAFDRDRCPLDAAMRMHFPPAETGGGAEADSGSPSLLLEHDRRYSRGHCWVLPRKDAQAERDLVRIGLEPGLAGALLTPRQVVRPMPQEHLRRGEAHVWIVTEGGTFPVAAPVDGTLRRVNPALTERPHLVASKPFDEGWLLEVEPDSSAADAAPLLDAAGAEHLYAQDARRFRAELARALRAVSAEAPALADGGGPLSSVSAMLGPARYFSLLYLVYT